MLLVYFWACKIALILVLDPSLLKQFLSLCCVVCIVAIFLSRNIQKICSATSPCPLIKIITSILNYKESLAGQDRNTERYSDRKEIQIPSAKCSGLKVLQQQQWMRILYPLNIWTSYFSWSPGYYVVWFFLVNTQLFMCLYEFETSIISLLYSFSNSFFPPASPFQAWFQRYNNLND